MKVSADCRNSSKDAASLTRTNMILVDDLLYGTMYNHQTGFQL